MKALLDSSCLFALVSPKDKYHLQALRLGDIVDITYLVPDIVLAETAYTLREQVGQKAVLNFLDEMASDGFVLEAVTKSDLARARAIMIQYATADFDLADCVIMAQSERLNIQHVCTFDYRDFRQFRPLHADHLILLPADM